MNDKGFGPAALDKSSTNKDAIRGREQQLIDSNGGAKSQRGTSGNAINGISPNNKKKNRYMKSATDEFGELIQLQSVQIHMVSLNLRKVQISSLHDRIAHALQIVFYILYLHLNSFG